MLGKLVHLFLLWDAGLVWSRPGGGSVGADNVNGCTYNAGFLTLIKVGCVMAFCMNKQFINRTFWLT